MGVPSIEKQQKCRMCRSRRKSRPAFFLGFFCHCKDNTLKFKVKKFFRFFLSEYGTENAFSSASAAQRCGGSGATELQS